MTPEKIIELARECGLRGGDLSPEAPAAKRLIRFAERIQSDTLEMAAEFCDASSQKFAPEATGREGVAWDSGYTQGAQSCATGIRALKPKQEDVK